MLAEQTDRSFKSVDLVLSGIADHIGRQGVTDTASYDRLMSRYETFLLLKEKISGLPHVEAVTLIDAKGTLINFSRSWPIPDVNVTDRDYYMVLKDDPKLESYISMPVRNRATGSWNIYVARRLNAPDGAFLGLVLGAVSMEYFENFFGTTVMGAGNSVSMVRDDGTLLARFPPSADIGGAVSMTAQRALNAGGIVRETSPSDREPRIVAARQLANYPVAIAVSQTEESALVEWRRMATLLGVTSLGCCLLIVIAAVVIARWWRDRDRAVRAAQAASDAKSSFLAVMSHEIRTPMNAVLGLAAELLNTPLTEEQRRSVVAMHDAGDNLLDLLNDILDFSKLEAGRLSFEAIAFSPETLVDNAVSVIGPRASAKGLAVKTVREAALPQALIGDAGRIRQVLLNLLSNAVKFTERGEVVVAIRCLARDAGHATIEWSVTDTGIGIPPDRIKDLFQDFSQADTSISRRFGGSGLGLSICKRLVEQMGGEISVVSAPGQGSTFRFSLALPITEEVALIGHDEPEPAFAGAARPYRRARPPAARPRRRRQRHQPAGRHQDAAGVRRADRDGVRRRRGGRGRHPVRLRRHPDGHAHAGDGRAAGDPHDPGARRQARRRRDRRVHRQCVPRRRERLPRRRHERLRRQAGAQEGAGRRDRGRAPRRAGRSRDAGAGRGRRRAAGVRPHPLRRDGRRAGRRRRAPPGGHVPRGDGPAHRAAARPVRP